MILIIMIISVLVPATLTTGIMECNLAQCDEDQRCYGELGESLFFHLPVGPRMRLTKNTKVIFKFANSTSSDKNSMCTESCRFFENGTFKLCNTTQTDSGAYQLEIHDKDGKKIKMINIILQILAPVSQPAMYQTCLSPEQKTVNCSAEGDDTEFLLSLDDAPLIQTKNKSVTITLNGQLTGNLQCNVGNKVSSKHAIIHLKSCEGPRFLTVTVLASVTAPLLLFIMLLGIKLFKLKRRSPRSIREDDAENEIVYSDIRVIRAAQKNDG